MNTDNAYYFQIQSLWSGDSHTCYNPPPNLIWTSLCTLSNVNMTLQPNASRLVSPNKPESYTAYESCCPEPSFYTYRRGCGLACYSWEVQNATTYPVAPWIDCLVEKGWARNTPELWCQNHSSDAPEYQQIGPKSKTSDASFEIFGISRVLTVMMCTIVLVSAYT